VARDRAPRSTSRAGRARAQRRRRSQFAIAGALAIVVVVGFIWIGDTAASAPSAPPAAQAGRVRGVESAPVAIEEYADFQCPACGQFARTTEAQLLRTYVANGQVKIVFHHFAFLGMESSWAAEAAECAADQGRFWDLHDRLYASQAGENRGAFSKANLKKMGDDLGLGASFAACVDSGRHAQDVRDSTAAGTDRGVRATPTLFVDGRKIEGAATYEQLKTIIDAALAR
jgi:protein-disulfide isomerase